MTPNSGAKVVRQFFTGTSGSYDHISNLCTFGADRWWKRKILAKIPDTSRLILDQACGTGILTIMIARQFPEAQVFGVDVTEEYIEIARAKARGAGLANTTFLSGRAEDVILDQPVDCITSSYLAKYADLKTLVRGHKKMLRNSGTTIMHDFTYPRSKAFARLWEFYFLLLRTTGAKKYPEWRAAFDGLPALLAKSQWVAELRKQLKRSGFSPITTESLTIGTAVIVTATKAS